MNTAGKSEDFDKALKFALCCIEKGDFTFKAEQLDAINCIYDGKDVFLWLPTGFGKSICYETLPFVFNHKHSDGGTYGGCSVVLVMSPLVSLMVDQVACLRSHGISPAIYNRPYIYLLRITTMCNLSIIGFVRFPFKGSKVQRFKGSSSICWSRALTI